MTESDPNEKPAVAQPMARRSALRLLALTGASLFAGGQSSYAFTDFFAGFGSSSASSLKGLNIPVIWQTALGPQLPSYVDFLKRCQLRNMTVEQVVEPHTHIRGGVHNTLPPKAMWGNIRSTLRVADSLSDRLDLHIKEVISVYRSPAYNAQCPGAKSSSYHMRNNAMDLVFPCKPGKVAAMARAMRSAGLYKGGVGRYPGFTHIDTRGSNADW
jgi:Peptidase M15